MRVQNLGQVLSNVPILGEKCNRHLPQDFIESVMAHLMQVSGDGLSLENINEERKKSEKVIFKEEETELHLNLGTIR